MTTLNLALPDSLAAFLSEQALRSGHKDPASYLKALIRTAQRRAAREELERKLIEGLQSGPTVKVTRDFWPRKKGRLLKRHAPAGRR